MLFFRSFKHMVCFSPFFSFSSQEPMPPIYIRYRGLSFPKALQEENGPEFLKNVCEHNKNVDVSQNNVKKVIKNAENVVCVREQSYLCIVKKIKKTQRCVEKDD